MRQAIALQEALIYLYVTVALAGVIVVLINTFLSVKLPHCSQRLSDNQMRISSFCCVFRALVNPGFIPFILTAGC